MGKPTIAGQADAEGAAVGHGTLTVSGVAVGFSGIPAGATSAVVTTEDADIRYWVDGSNPTTTAGHLLAAGSVFELEKAGQIASFKAVAVTGTATLQVSYF